MRLRWLLPGPYLTVVVLATIYFLRHPTGDSPIFSVGLFGLPWIIVLANINSGFWVGFSLSIGLNLFVLYRLGAWFDLRRVQ